MRQWIALSSGGVAALLGLVLLWGGIGTETASAMEKMAQNVRDAKSYKYTAVARTSFVSKQGDSAKTVERTTQSKWAGYWLTPNSIRVETTYSSTWQGPGPEETRIMPGLNRSCISIDNSTKTFSRLPPRADEFSPLERLESYGQFSGSADRELGTREIGGREALGFVIDTKSIDPDLPSQIMEIWIDTETKLPVLLRFDSKTQNMSRTVEVSDIQWNIDLDPGLFDPTPPEGYTDVTPKPPSSEEQVGPIIDALRTYAKASGGHYPQKKPFAANSVGELMDMLAVHDKAQPKDPPGTDVRAVVKRAIKKFDRIPAEKQDEVMRAAKAFGQMNELEHFNPDFAYYGKTVMPGDRNKVLLRWKLDDGRYHVIFGNLQSETVTAERLRALEGK